MVRLKQLVDEFGTDKTTIIKASKKMGLNYVRMVFELHGQSEIAFTDEDAAKLRIRYAHRKGKQNG